MLQIFLLDKISNTKSALFFLSRAPTHHSLTFNLQLLHDLKQKVRLSKTVCGIFHFQFNCVSFLFLLTKSLDSLTLKRHNSFQNKNNRKATDSYAPRPLIFKLQQEV